ncbi:N-acetylmuramidase family protein [Moraxella sp. Pampa]|uniref:N-acetylmuramidase family protein n=1 Tax=Moraxella sp. Pampa TaxID=3111978 RepID=UPI002B411405|nr:N-acetylmuramidase family protein [Moraxella sp. Pampa]
MKSIKYGQKGEIIAQLQAKLNKHGAKLAIDGDFGTATEKAVVDFQTKHNLMVDGIVGQKTWDALEGKAIQHLITPADYEAAANELGVPVNVIRAFGRVESVGAGFIQPNKPKILFERHIFYRLVKAKYGKARADQLAQNHANIISPKTGGYQGGASEYVRLNFAKTIDEACAYSSASWGMFQIMGENWQMLGYESIDDFVEQMNASETQHLNAFVRFIKTKKGLLDALQKGDWEKVFTLYNGKAYKKLGYDHKFLAELRRLDELTKA